MKSKEELLDDLLLVGISKSIGYLPLTTIIDICNTTIDKLINYANEYGLKYRLFSGNECQIGSGALCLYSEEDLYQLLQKYKDVLENAGVPVDSTHNYVEYIFNNIVDKNEYGNAYIAIGKTFNDKRFRDIIL